MNTKTLANNYSQLNAEERFRLILAAGSREDLAEGNRLINAGQRITLSAMDHAPYADAFQELASLAFIDLLSLAATYQECNALADKLLAESHNTTRTRRNATSMPAQAKGETSGDETIAYPAWHHMGRTAYAFGFILKVKVEGWRLFCAEMNVAPFAWWEQKQLPGLGRIVSALALARAGAAFPSAGEMACWLDEAKPRADRKRTEADVKTPAMIAAELDATFRERVGFWGG